MSKKKANLIISILTLLLILCFYYQNDIKKMVKEPSYSSSEIPDFMGKKSITLNNNKPEFEDGDYDRGSFEHYSNLDYLERAGVAFANVGEETMPTEKRGSIGMIKPTGWHTIKYDIIKDKYLYNRCHLIGYQLTGENANPKNLITCTRYLNATSMLAYENKVANYVKETKKHVLYRVTPIYRGSNLLATGVQIEASSVEDRCTDICFNVFLYNVQDGIVIDYTNGDSYLER